MKNFILGYMVAAWSWPTVREVSLRVMERAAAASRPEEEKERADG